MDCCVCGPMAVVYRPPRNAICQSCYDGARSMIFFLKKLDDGENEDNKNQDRNNRHQYNSKKGLSDVFTWMKGRREIEEGLKDKIDFLGALSTAYREGIHTDIVIQPGTGLSIPAHRALLATRSEIFKTMLGSEDNCKIPAKDSISFPDISHEQLQCLLQFLYDGSLPEDGSDEQVYGLLVAADKYDIPYLKKACELQLLGKLSPSNALDILVASDLCSSQTLTRNAMEMVEKHADDVVFSNKFEEFALKNAHLCVQIARMLVKNKKDGGTTNDNHVNYY